MLQLSLQCAAINFEGHTSCVRHRCFTRSFWQSLVIFLITGRQSIPNLTRHLAAQEFDHRLSAFCRFSMLANIWTSRGFVQPYSLQPPQARLCTTKMFEPLFCHDFCSKRIQQLV